MIFYIFFIVLLICALLCAWLISVADFRRRIIPDAYLFPLLLIGLLIVNFFPWPISSAESAVAGAFGYIIAALIGFIFDIIRRRKSTDTTTPIGMGDIKLIGTGGIWLGATGLSIALIIACLTGTIWGIYKKQRFIPFAPFFLIGGFLALIVIGFLI